MITHLNSAKGASSAGLATLVAPSRSRFNRYSMELRDQRKRSLLSNSLFTPKKMDSLNITKDESK